MDSSDRIQIDQSYDTRTDDSTSGYTLASLTTGFRYENGRTYHVFRGMEVPFSPFTPSGSRTRHALTLLFICIFRGPVLGTER